MKNQAMYKEVGSSCSAIQWIQCAQVILLIPLPINTTCGIPVDILSKLCSEHVYHNQRNHHTYAKHCRHLNNKYIARHTMDSRQVWQMCFCSHLLQHSCWIYIFGDWPTVVSTTRKQLSCSSMRTNPCNCVCVYLHCAHMHTAEWCQLEALEFIMKCKFLWSSQVSH